MSGTNWRRQQYIMNARFYNLAAAIFRWRHWISYLLMILLPVAMVFYDASNNGGFGPRYVFPLTNEFFVYSPSPYDLSPSDRETYGDVQIIKLSADYELNSDPVPLALFYPGSVDSVDCIRHVEGMVISGDNIIGLNKAGYFLLNVKYPKLAVYSSSKEFNADLASKGIPNRPLHAPEEMAEALSTRITQPWDYQAMGGLFGLTDNKWSAIVVDIGFLMAIMIGLSVPRGKTARRIIYTKVLLFCLGSVLGFTVVEIAYDRILGSGPDCFIGTLFVMPFLAMVTVLSKEIPAFIDLLIALSRPSESCAGATEPDRVDDKGC